MSQPIDSLPFGTDLLQFNNYWLFSLQEPGENSVMADPGKAAGRLWIRPNMAVCGREGSWQVLGKTGRPRDQIRKAVDEALIAIHVDNDVVMVRSISGKVYRVLETFSADPDTFVWRASYGWPFDHGPQLSVTKDYYNYCLSSSKEWSTVYTSDTDGNRHHRFIDHIYCLSRHDNLIHHNDPWTPGDWLYAFTTPEGGRIIPGRKSVPGIPGAINVSGAVVALIAPKGVWTIEYDFDIAGGNPLAVYEAGPLELYEGVAPIVRFEKGARPIRLPSLGWRYHGPLPGICTANIQVSPCYDPWGKIVPGPDSRMLRILGARVVEGLEQAGYWEKELDDATWRFVPHNLLSLAEIKSHNIHGEPQSYGPPLVRDWINRKKPKKGGAPGNLYLRSLDDFLVNGAFFEPARLVLELASGQIGLVFHTHVQMRTSRFERGLSRVRGPRPARWFGGYALLPEDLDLASRAELEKAFKCKPGARSLKVLLRLDHGRLEVIRPVFKLNADLVNALNRLLGKTLAVLEPKPDH